LVAWSAIIFDARSSVIGAKSHGGVELFENLIAG
jgi:hypothetical protein